MRYKARHPEIVQAHRVMSVEDFRVGSNAPAWLREAWKDGRISVEKGCHGGFDVEVGNLRPMLAAKWGWFVLRDASDNLGAMHADDFAATYEEMDE